MNDKNYSSLKDSGKKGFGTFILTLSISLIVFSTIYYLMTNSSSESDQPDTSLSSVSKVVDQNAPPSVQGDADSQKTIFGEIAEVNPSVPYKQVLAGATEAETDATVSQTTQSPANLDTGITSITLGLFFALILFSATIVFVYNNPRKMALSTFEKKTTKDL